jgi:hypothetical protein
MCWVIRSSFDSRGPGERPHFFSVHTVPEAEDANTCSMNEQMMTYYPAALKYILVKISTFHVWPLLRSYLRMRHLPCLNTPKSSVPRAQLNSPQWVSVQNEAGQTWFISITLSVVSVDPHTNMFKPVFTFTLFLQSQELNTSSVVSMLKPSCGQPPCSYQPDPHSWPVH